MRTASRGSASAVEGNSERSFGGGPDTTEAEFSEQSTLVHFFEESGAQRVPSTFSLTEFRSALWSEPLK